MSLREKKKAATLAAIRTAAAELFAERGYEATRTRDIAERAGIATGTLFNYAPTKQDVVRLVWRDRAERAAEAGLAAAADIGDPRDAVTEIFRPVFAFYAEDLELGKVFLNAVVYQRHGEMAAFNAGFIARIAGLLSPVAGASAPLAAVNVFGAYFLVLTMLLAGQLDGPEAALGLLRGLVRTQAEGWSAASR